MTRVARPRIALEKREEYPGNERIALEKEKNILAKKGLPWRREEVLLSL